MLALTLAIPDVAHAEPEGGGAAPLPGVTDEPDAPSESSPRGDDQLDRAMAAFARGSDNYNRAMYQQALSDFLEAATLYASPDFQYNIALCYEKLDKPEEAIGAFETYLKTKRDVPDRANVEDRIRRLRAEVERRAGQPDVPPPRVEPAPTTTDAPATDGKARTLVIAGAVVAGVGAAVALGGGLGLGIAAKRRSDDLQAVQDGGNPDGLSFDQARALEDEGKGLELGQIVTVAIGGAIAVGGVAILAVGLSRKKKKAAAPGPAATLAPGLGRTSFGLSLSGRF